MVHAIQSMTDVASPKAVREFHEVEEAITSWENKVKKLESECGEKISDTMKTAIVTRDGPGVDPRLRLHQRRRHDQVPGGGGQAQVVGGGQALDDERTCPNERWRGVRRAVGGGDGTLVGNGRAGGVARGVFQKLRRIPSRSQPVHLKELGKNGVRKDEVLCRPCRRAQRLGSPGGSSLFFIFVAVDPDRDPNESQRKFLAFTVRLFSIFSIILLFPAVKYYVWRREYSRWCAVLNDAKIRWVKVEALRRWQRNRERIPRMQDAVAGDYIDTA